MSGVFDLVFSSIANPIEEIFSTSLRIVEILTMIKIFASILLIIGSMLMIGETDTTRSSEVSRHPASPRIIGGYQSSIVWVPYYVYVSLKEGNIVRSCGGAIISRTWVLTAAHCLYRHRRRIPDDGIILYAGMSRTDVPEDFVQVQHVIFSMVYDKWTNPVREQIVNHDIALLQTCTSWEYTRGVQPIHLAPNGYVLPDGVDALACGFGDTKTWGPAHGSQELYAVMLKKGRCWASRIVKTILCFEGTHSSVSGICHGDSGGPLMYLDDKTPILIGVASGTGCKNNIGGGSFTDVSLYRDWIREVTGI